MVAALSARIAARKPAPKPVPAWVQRRNEGLLRAKELAA